MKLKRVFAILLVALMLVATGCTGRNKNQNGVSSLPSTSVPDVASRIEDGLDNFRSDVENGISGLEDNMPRIEDGRVPSEGYTGESLYENSENSLPSSSGFDTSLPDESAAATMSTDFEQIGALPADKLGWGPGTNSDGDGRPYGSLDYQEKYGKYNAYYIAPNSNKIYLTFDEGYENTYTASILDTLKEKDVKAVFFITYPYATSQPDLVRRMVAEGHIVGNHSTKHLSFPDMPLQEAADDITKLHDYVKANYGYTMSLFRPPMGEFSERTLALAQSLGYSSVFWSVAYRDWEVDNQPLTIEAMNTLLSRCHPGAIYLLHAVSQTNAEILGEFIDNVRAKGFEFTRFDWA